MFRHRRRASRRPRIVAASIVVCAFAASGVALGVATPPRVSIVARGLTHPLYVTAPPGDSNRLYVVQQNGIVRVIERGRVRSRPFLDLTRRVATGGERGLLSIAFSPRYPTDRLLYAFYTDRESLNVVELRESGGSVQAASARVLVRVPHEDSPYHNGGQLQFGPDGLLYAGFGDGGYRGRDPDPRGNSQNLDVLLGKLARFDVAAQPPDPQLVAYGLRNPWRFSFDALTGDLVIADVGWFGVEELNVLRAGTGGLVNFGWSVYEGRAPRTRGEPVTLNPAGELAWPAYSYSTARRGNCSIVGGYVYRGRRVPRLRGRYVFGDYCSGRVWTARLQDGRIGDVKVEPFRVPRLASFGLDAAGELYAVSLCTPKPGATGDGACPPRTGTVYRFVR